MLRIYQGICEFFFRIQNSCCKRSFWRFFQNFKIAQNFKIFRNKKYLEITKEYRQVFLKFFKYIFGHKLRQNTSKSPTVIKRLIRIYQKFQGLTNILRPPRVIYLKNKNVPRWWHFWRRISHIFNIEFDLQTAAGL